jgi:hypothetical protein
LRFAHCRGCGQGAGNSMAKTKIFPVTEPVSKLKLELFKNFGF